MTGRSAWIASIAFSCRLRTGARRTMLLIDRRPGSAPGDWRSAPSGTALRSGPATARLPCQPGPRHPRRPRCPRRLPPDRRSSIAGDVPGGQFAPRQTKGSHDGSVAARQRPECAQGRPVADGGQLSDGNVPRAINPHHAPESGLGTDSGPMEPPQPVPPAMERPGREAKDRALRQPPEGAEEAVAQAMGAVPFGSGLGLFPIHLNAPSQTLDRGQTDDPAASHRPVMGREVSRLSHRQDQAPWS